MKFSFLSLFSPPTTYTALCLCFCVLHNCINQKIISWPPSEICARLSHSLNIHLARLYRSDNVIELQHKFNQIMRLKCVSQQQKICIWLPMRHAKVSLSTTSIIFGSITYTHPSVRPRVWSLRVDIRARVIVWRLWVGSAFGAFPGRFKGRKMVKILNSNIFRYYAHKTWTHHHRGLRRDDLSGAQRAEYHIRLCNRFRRGQTRLGHCLIKAKSQPHGSRDPRLYINSTLPPPPNTHREIRLSVCTHDNIVMSSRRMKTL